MPGTCRFIDLICRDFPELTKKEAYAFILSGKCTLDGEKIRDPNRTVVRTKKSRILREKYISRGGYKLQGPLEAWNIETAGKVFLDAGASTGGFTHCLLKAGAGYVHAVDVGYNQLDYRLRSDRRVAVYERTNIMDIHHLEPKPEGAVVDLSFRSVTGAAPHILNLTNGKWGIFLIKPQFEAAASGEARETGFDGVIRDPETVTRILCTAAERLSERCIGIRAVMPSPVPGRGGNREFFFFLFINTGMEGKIAGKNFNRSAEEIKKAVDCVFRHDQENDDRSKGFPI